MTPVDPAQIAARLRGLIGRADLGVLAQELGVAEETVRMSVDEATPHPTIEVIIAVIRRYGVDPTWLMTGEYDATRHRAAIGEDHTPSRSVIAALIAEAAAPTNPLDLRQPQLPM
jgi:hypothetical protein